MKAMRSDAFVWRTLRMDPWPGVREIEYVVRRLRENDKREVYGCRFNSDPDALIEDIYRRVVDCPLAYTVRHRDRPNPIGLLMFPSLTPVALNGWFVATDEWRLVAVVLTEWIRRFGLPILAGKGWQRIECRVMEDYTVSRRWLEWGGFEAETGPIVLGGNGETYVQYALDLQRRYGPCAQA